MRFSAAESPLGDGFALQADTRSPAALRAPAEPRARKPARIDTAPRWLPSVRLGMGSVWASIRRRTREPAAADDDDLAVLINLQGRHLVRSRDREVPLEPGEGLLLACDGDGDVVTPQAGLQLCVRLERRLLGAFAKHVDRCLGQVIPAGCEALGLLASYAQSLSRGGAQLSPAAARLVVEHVADLVALIVDSTGEPAALASRQGRPAARVVAAKAFVRENLGRTDLSAATAAAGLGITPRYLRRLFAAEDHTFSGYVLEQRLLLAHALLSSRTLAMQPVADVAFEVGFGDLSYFNRAFRRRFERAPRDVRTEALARA
jgi:AraC-like DNA-binding protein